MSTAPLAFATPAQTVPQAAALQTVVLAMTDAPQSWAKETSEAINLLLADAGTHLRLEIRALPYTELEGPAILSGEESEGVDLFLNPYGQRTKELADAGLIVDISQSLLNYPNLYNTTPERAWLESTVDGKIVCFPILSKYSGEGEMTYLLEIRPDVFGALALPFPETPEALMNALQTAKEKSAEDLLFTRQKLLCAIEAPPYALHRTYDQWPFFVDHQSRFVLYNDGTVGPYIGSDIFLQDRAYMEELYRQDLLSLEETSAFSDDRYPTCAAAFEPKVIPPPLDPAYASFDEEGNIITFADMQTFGTFASDKGVVRIGPCARTALYVSKQCDDVEAALAMLELLYTQKDLSYMLFYGPEGEDVEITYSYRVFLTHQLQQLAYLGTPYVEDDSNFFLGSGFLFDEDAAGTGQWQDMNLMDTWMLRAGAYPLEQMDDILNALNAQGYQQMLEECQRQYTEYIARFQ